jgi:hypothetical protein
VLSQDFREFIQSLNAHDVRYLIIGGYAVALHGHPRYTKDLDVWVDSSEENATRLVAALKEFGFTSLELKPDDFMESGQVIQLGFPPNRIDLVTSADGVEFAECYATRVTVDLDDVPVQFISLDGLKKNKKASGRPQDFADLEALD